MNRLQSIPNVVTGFAIGAARSSSNKFNTLKQISISLMQAAEAIELAITDEPSLNNNKKREL